MKNQGLTIERIEKVAVIGSGVMGHGIAELLAINGIKVVMVGKIDKNLQKSMEKIKWSLDKFVEKQKITKEDADAALARISTTTSYNQAAKEIDLAIEAVPENMGLKMKVFSTLDSVSPPHAIFASNTSTLSITQMGKATKRPDKTAGMHFFNPAYSMALVEVIKGDDTNQETIDALVELAKKLGKTPVIVRKDVHGFIVTRILWSVFNEAFWAFNRGEAKKEGIDASVKYVGGFPIGWFEMADFVGLDVVYEVGKILHEAYGERMKPCDEVIKPLVQERKLGQKTGLGFYDWTKGRPKIPIDLRNTYDVDRLWVIAVNEAAWLINDDVASPKDIDAGMKLGTYWPSGPCEYADRAGLDIMLEKLKALHGKYGMEIYRPCPLLEDYVKKGRLGKKTVRGFYS
jgi:enoyl-CoA hydratase / 3-hydroxyacyl-CoA dehydrogenase